MTNFTNDSSQHQSGQKRPSTPDLKATAAAESTTPSLRGLLDEHGWLSLSSDGVVQCPFLVKGRLVGPPTVEAEAIARAFAVLDERRGTADAYAQYVTVGDAQVLRHVEIDRRSEEHTY